MTGTHDLCFGHFRLDVRNACVWIAQEVLSLTPKALAMLQYLAERPGQLVTRTELLEALWPDTVVGDAVLTVGIAELRKALGDDSQSPRFIETVHRRGYRFLPTVTAQPGQSSRFQLPNSETQHSALSPPLSFLVGREAELAHLHDCYAHAVNGQRQIVFVTGEPGIGKTTVVETFLRHLDMRDVRVGRGQCIEQYGAGEAYLPILEALGRLGREPGGDQLIACLHRYAPTWLVQLPILLDRAERETLQRTAHVRTRERMLREMVEMLDLFTAERPLVLWLEDLQWSDPSTLELLALLARRREPARLLVLGTYRPIDIRLCDHPLRTVKQELQLHEQCIEVVVQLLTEEAVAEYLRYRAPKGVTTPFTFQQVAHTIHQRTEGNPLFMVHIVAEMLEQEQMSSAVVEGRVPETIRQMIEQQVERLSIEEQRLLEVASVVGVEFSAAAVAAGADTSVEAVEYCCAALVRRGQWLQVTGTAEWPEGTVATRYRFRHALHREVLYERIPAGQRPQFHYRIGECLEAGYGPQATAMAAELAVHFEHGRDYARAVEYLALAASNALQRSAYQEALALLRTSLALVEHLPDTLERMQQELRARLLLTTPLMALNGFANTELDQVYTRAEALCERLGTPPQLFAVLGGRFELSLNRGELHTALEIAQRFLRVAEGVHEPQLLRWAHYSLGTVLQQRGEYELARTHLEQSLAVSGTQPSPFHDSTHDPQAIALMTLGWTLYALGYPTQARQKHQNALSCARRVAHPLTLALVLVHVGNFYAHQEEWDLAQALEEECRTLAQEQGFTHWITISNFRHGLTLFRHGQHQEGIAHMHQALEAVVAEGITIEQPWLRAQLAECYGKLGQAETGIQIVAAALTLLPVWHGQADLYRLKGELTLQQGQHRRSLLQVPFNKNLPRKPPFSRSPLPPLPPNTQAEEEREAEACFHKAIAIAQRQQAKSWELRASMSLVQLWRRQGKQRAARQLLTDIYGWFTEGFDTKDLQDAKALLEDLS